MQKGYTTGTCATVAAKAAAKMLFTKQPIKYESIVTPNGTDVKMEILQVEAGENYCRCGVRKFSGDDPDVTNGIMIYATVKLSDKVGIAIDGGIGVGRVTKAGLEQPIGSAAINSVPRQMITAEIEDTLKLYNYQGGAEILIEIPQGAELAKKTFNPRLGIEGGISVLGTTGIIEPMSTKALIDTIRVEMSVKRANSNAECVLTAPGNYGIDFLLNIGIDIEQAVKFSNFIGDAIELACEAGFKQMLIVGHIGKLIKLSGGIMNTHSKNADCRMEILSAFTSLFSDDISLVRRVYGCNTTDEAAAVLENAGILQLVMDYAAKKARQYAQLRCGDKMQIGVLIFSNSTNCLGKTENIDEMLKIFKNEGK